MTALNSPERLSPETRSAGRQGPLARSGSNLAATRRIVMARARRRRTRPGSLRWVLPAVLWVGVIAAVALLLDARAASLHGHLPRWLLTAAEIWTRVALGGVYILPAVLVLVWANLTDWGAWRGQRLLVIYNRTAAAAFVTSAIVVPGLLVNMLKYGIGRARPFVTPDLGVFQFHPFAMRTAFSSFPSGHATTTGAVAAMLILLFPKWRFVIAALALWIAATRVILAAHHPSDIVAGLGLGAATTVLLAMLFARLGYLFEIGPDGLPRVRKRALILK